MKGVHLLLLTCAAAMFCGCQPPERQPHSSRRASTADADAKLPEADKVYLTVFGDGRDARFKTVVEWMKRAPLLQRLRAETHFHTIDTRSPLFQQRYAKTTPRALHVRLQAGEGCCTDIHSHEVPGTAEAFGEVLLARLLKLRCLFRRLPATVDNSVNIEWPSTVVAEEPKPQPKTADHTWRVLFVLAAVAGGGLALARSYQQGRAAA